MKEINKVIVDVAMQSQELQIGRPCEGPVFPDINEIIPHYLQPKEIECISKCY